MLKKLIMAVVAVGVLSVAGVAAADYRHDRRHSHRYDYSGRLPHPERQGYVYERRHGWRPEVRIVAPLPMPGAQGVHGRGYLYFRF